MDQPDSKLSREKIRGRRESEKKRNDPAPRIRIDTPPPKDKAATQRSGTTRMNYLTNRKPPESAKWQASQDGSHGCNQ